MRSVPNRPERRFLGIKTGRTTLRVGRSPVTRHGDLRTISVDFGTLGDFWHYIASSLFQGSYRNAKTGFWDRLAQRLRAAPTRSADLEEVDSQSFIMHRLSGHVGEHRQGGEYREKSCWVAVGASHYENKSEKNNCVCEFHRTSLIFISAPSFTLSLVLDMAVYARFLLSILRWCGRWRTSPSPPHSKWPCAPTRPNRHIRRPVARLP
jgi:hypothetical protein